MEEGWSIGYTDGTGVNGTAALGEREPTRPRGGFLGGMATVVAAKRKAMALGAEQGTAEMLFSPTDYLAALYTAMNLSNGTLPRSGVEIDLKNALRRRRDQETHIAGIRSHIGIPSNVTADQPAY